MMRRIVRVFFVTFSIFIFALFTLTLTWSVRADELSDVQKQIDDLSRQLELSKNATTPLVSEVKKLEDQLASIQARLGQVSRDIAKSEEELAFQKKVLGATVRHFYINSYVDIPLLTIFASQDATEALKLIALQQQSSRHDRQIIAEISAKVAKLADDKKRLAQAQAQVAKQSQFLKGEIASARAFQSELEGKIAALTARQQEILAAKSGTFTTSVGEVPLADDPNASPNFSPGFSPAFAGFSFGAYTHRNGMSQYGAKGRAEAGQKTEDILSHYYPGANLNKNYAVPGSITVDGYGSMPFEDVYMKRIYEMPNSFPKEALRAQAVAARTYAIRYSAGGANSICATQSCQVYKNENKGGEWEAAVNETRGWVLEGGPNAQYSSTTGGYLNNSGWDTKCGNRGCWTGDAYEKLSGSPWFYKGWYTASYTTGSDKCGRSHPWLTLSETVDILNAYLVQGKDVDSGRITPVTTSCWGGNPYSIVELADLANQKAGGAATSISSVSVTYSENGTTASVSFETNRGAISISGSDFKTIFNLRAPGYISIRSPLYNIERK